MSRPTKFTVDRSKWLRGCAGQSMLLDREGNMCCLGFVSAQCGVPADALINNPAPWHLLQRGHDDAADPIRGILLLEDVGIETDLANAAMNINDCYYDADAEREPALARLFANHGYELEFIGEGRPA
jgi:hypothetical protein